LCEDMVDDSEYDYFESDGNRDQTEQLHFALGCLIFAMIDTRHTQYDMHQTILLLLNHSDIYKVKKSSSDCSYGSNVVAGCVLEDSWSSARPSRPDICLSATIAKTLPIARSSCPQCLATFFLSHIVYNHVIFRVSAMTM